MAAPKTSTPYFPASEQKSEVRERSPRRVAQRKSMSSGHVVEEQSKFCEHHGPMVGYIRGRFGESSFAMDFSCSYKEADLEKWTKATKFKIWEAARSEWTEEEPQQIGTDGLVLNATTLFEENDLILSRMDSKCLDSIGKLFPKVNLICHFAPKDDFSYHTNGRSGHENRMFSSSIRTLNLIVKKTNFWIDRLCFAINFLVVPAKTPSTL